ncbi:MAG: hypothetical protein KF709_13085 [Gemmatimonadaceae bacterium]|nr:hypothetical protein [Gemmatimonadaceae bacterium]
MPATEQRSVEELMSGVLETEHTVRLNRGDIDPISLRRYEGHASPRRIALAIVAVIAAVVAAAALVLSRLR